MNRESTPDFQGPSSSKREPTSPPLNEKRKDSSDAAAEDSNVAQNQTTDQPKTTTESKESHFFDSIDLLTKWMNGYVWDVRLLDHRDFTLEELQAGLHGGYALIDDKLDMEMRAVVDTARDRYHNIDVKIDDMYRTRDQVWSHRIGEYLYHWDAPTLKKWLLGARKEITWLRNEMRRLECHMENAERLIKEGLRKRFTYIPSSREWMED